MTYNVTSIQGDDDDATITVEQVAIPVQDVGSTPLADGEWVYVKVRAGTELYELVPDARTSADILDAYVTLKRYGRLVRVGEGDNDATEGHACEHPVVRTDDYCESCDDYLGEGAWREAVEEGDNDE